MRLNGVLEGKADLVDFAGCGGRRGAAGVDGAPARWVPRAHS